MSWRKFFLQVLDPEEEQNEESAVVVTDEKGQKMQASGDEVTFQTLRKCLILLNCYWYRKY